MSLTAIVGKLARSATLGLSLAVSSIWCGNQQEYKNGNNMPTTDVAINAPAGSVGTCVEVEVYPGYTTCLLDESQGANLTINRYEQPLITELPEMASLRSFIDSYCPPVHNQGPCGWCVPHAVTAAMEVLECKITASERISEPHLWYLGRGDVNNCKGGWSINAGVNTAKENKLIAGSLWPYSIESGVMTTTKPADTILQEQGKYNVDGYTIVGNSDIDTIKLALKEGNPVVAAVPVFLESGWSSGDDNYGTITLPGEDAQIRGYHAILLVGYDAGIEQFLLRNSWGEEWADRGYATISFEYIQQSGRAIVPTINTEICAPRVSKTCQDNDVYWVDSCGKVEEVAEECLEGLESCIDATCKGLEGKIVFVSGIGTDTEIYSMNANGSNSTRLTNNEFVDEGPRWSPDGSKITFVSSRDGNSEIYVMNADGSNQTRLTYSGGYDYSSLSWSPDGTKIVYTKAEYTSEWYDLDIYVMNSDGTNQTSLLGNSNCDSSPDWSPDGTKITFVSQRNDNSSPSCGWNYEIYVMNVDGGDQTRLTDGIELAGSPHWSPDGTMIVYTSEGTDYLETIFIMNADGSNQTALLNNIDTVLGVGWSPDGTKIISSLGGGYNYEIQVMNTDGSNRTELFSGRRPDWTW